MKFFSSVFAIFLLVASVLAIDAGATAQPPDNNCGTGFSQTGERTNTNDKQGDSLVKGELSHAESTNSDVPHPGQNNPDQNNPDQNNPGQKNTPDQNATSSDGSQEQAPPVLNGDCILTGVYINNTDVSECHSILVRSLHVPAGLTLNLTQLQNNTRISFQGTTTFGKMLWAGPLVELQGNNLTVTGPGTLDGQGAWYWAQARNVTKPRWLFKMHKVVNSTVYTTITGVTVNSSTGDGIAKNTDGFDLDKNDHVTITRNRIFGQDDCLAMQSSTNTVFSYNFCCGTHGISIGSLGGPEQNVSTTVDGLTVTGNTIVNSTNGIRIKTIIELKGLVTNAVYTDNELSNVTHAIVVHSDYNKTKGGYAGTPTSLVKITNITIDGLKGTSENLYDIVSNPDVVSNWIFKNINVARIKHRKLHR
ncbi:polygalacturonase, putative [Phytophthora infestans T30-4]|uniref:endo-polygalacturonase n=1 Tax=Phytophthora infestans (strain T30-4) TaxID=403677 RepID=D0NHA9_PHYIT|nr:polygalacturonase, putative [Phytophthora infestans T30-4]EEY58748.1 polygalacturonase, putative [Phytophthora infestans T30-4]|eukprot:XP_002901692.1 polygalacturonase, putative [Phytophthora infestans T30-4]